MKTSNKHNMNENESNKKHEHRSEHTEHKTEHIEHKQATESASGEKKMPGSLYPVISVIIMVILVALVVYLLVRPSVPSTVSPGTYTGEKTKVEFYVMSKCPYGTQVENAFAPVLEQMGDAVDFQLNYIVKESAPGTFESLHGDTEVTGDIAQLCAKSYYPDKYFKMIVCQNKDAANMATNWKQCAQDLGMDTAKLQKCLDTDEGKGLLRTSMQRTMARGATGSPTMYFNDVSYQGARDAASFQREICKSSKSSACTSIPKCAVDTDCTEQTGKEGTCNNPGKADASCTGITAIIPRGKTKVS